MSRTLISLRRVFVAALVSCAAACGLLLVGLSAQARAAGSAAATVTQSATEAECPNQAFRTGAGGRLPDCRAYEMVTPVEKGGKGTEPGCNTFCRRAGISESSLDGDKLTYASSASFGDQPSDPYSSQYIASRGANGWSSHGINAPRDNTIYRGFSYFEFNTQYDAFTEDLATAWMHNDNATPLAPGALHGVVDLYKRDNTTDTYQALTVEPMIPAEELSEVVTFGGGSADGSHSVFLLNKVLYDFNGTQYKVVNILPDGTVSQEPHFGAAFFESEDYAGYGNALTEHAVSNDGSRIFWTDGVVSPEGIPNGLYVRIDGSRTVKIAENGVFRDASTDGAKVLFDTGFHSSESDYGNLYEFDVETQTTHLIAGREFGVLGASDDLSYVYFVSQEALAAGAEEGKFNLYVDHEGSFSTVAILSPEDVGLAKVGGVATSEFYNGEPDVASRKPIDRPARVTPDGRHIAFDSVASLAGSDNLDAVTGKPDVEVYTYDAGTDQLTCVSCNSSGARPVGQNLPRPYAVDGEAYSEHMAAAWLPTSETSVYSSRPLSDDGDRLFFNSFEALVPQDGNSAQDVYEWEASGAGSCRKAGGCVNLISSGESPSGSEFVDASPNGDDVFFTTQSSLVSQDPGLLDIYDARVDGGFPAPHAVAVSCEGEACQSPPASPSDTTPSSASFNSPLVSAATAPLTPKKTSAAPKKTAAQTRAARLAKALKACRALARSRRKGCEAKARRRYGTKRKRVTRSTKGGK